MMTTHKESGRVVYLNGEFVPESEAKISIYDSALMFGDMVFEMTRSFNRKQHLLREHFRRLYRSLRYVGIPLRTPIEEMEEIVHETIRRNEPAFDPNDEHRIMINVSRGPLSLYSEVFGGKLAPTVVVSDFPVKWVVGPLAPLYDTGVHAVIPSQRMIPTRLLESKVKNRSRLHYLMANLQVSRLNDPTAWALLSDEDGFICEGTGANFFIVKDGKLITPEPRNILRGIKRDYVMKLARRADIQAVEKNIEPYDVLEAEEAFFTSTAFSMMPCTRFEGRAIGDGAMGKVTRQLLDAWSADVGVDILQQTRDYGKAVKGMAGAGVTPYRFSEKLETRT